jgi:ribonuclease P protein component
MLAKKSRLTSRQVREIIKSGRSVRLGTLSAKFVKGTSTKAAVVVSVKVAKNAVERNKLRRAAYYVLRTSIPKGIHVVFFLHKPILDQRELNSLCLKLI